HGCRQAPFHRGGRQAPFRWGNALMVAGLVSAPGTARSRTITPKALQPAFMIMAIWPMGGGRTNPNPAASAWFHDHGHFSAYRTIVSVIMEVALVVTEIEWRGSV